MSSPGLKVCFSLALVFCLFLQISANINPSSHDPITFSVYHIGHLMRPFFKDYESFTVAGLARDRAGFSFATSSHDHLKGKYRLRTDFTAFPPVTRPLGEYAVRVQVGKQRQKAHLMLDTGSSFIQWQCHPCTNCYPQEDPIYYRRNSTSYSPVDFVDEPCDELQGFIHGCLEDAFCGFTMEYVDNTMARGILASELIWSKDGT